MDYVLEMIDNSPTEDVVPRSEVEHWKQEANRYQGLWCKTYNDFEISELITEAKQDVASEIFEEIERNFHEDDFGDLTIDFMEFQELKKKYIGE
jgi:hypothetical protein